MPTYEFKCPNGHQFEKFSPTMNSDRRVKCPVCGKMAERQISGGAGLVFKGSGFYMTGDRWPGEQQADQRDEAKPAESKRAAEAKPESETKPADSAKKKHKPGDK